MATILFVACHQFVYVFVFVFVFLGSCICAKFGAKEGKMSQPLVKCAILLMFAFLQSVEAQDIGYRLPTFQ